MEANKMFEVAVRNKFRYPYKGVIATEDLWDLSVQQLDDIFKTLKSQEKKGAGGKPSEYPYAGG